MARFLEGESPVVTFAVQGGTTGTQPTFNGDPLFTSQYIKIGKLVHFEHQVDFDNITSFGTGQYYMTLPYPAASPIEFRGGALHDSSAGTTYHISGSVEAGSSTMYLFSSDKVSSGVQDVAFTSSVPVTLSTADNFHISGTYIAQ